MKNHARWLVLVMLGAGFVQAAAPPAPPADWSVEAKQLAHDLVAQYGAPTHRGATEWTWVDNGVWHRTSLFSTGAVVRGPTPYRDVLAQSIDYAVPARALAAVSGFSACLEVNRAEGLLIAHCGNPGMNMLTLNLANEIATGKRSVADARAFYRRNAVDYANRKASMYTERLLFEPMRGVARGPLPGS